MQNKNNKKNGYTIIETMISVSIFLVVVMAGMGALLNANLLHSKSQNMRSIVDNLSFIMEDMSRNLRTGYNYYCINSSHPNIPTNSNDTNSCSNGDGKGISFKATGSSAGQWVYNLSFCDGKEGICKSVDGGNPVQLVPDEVVIDSSSSFTVVGAEPPEYDLYGTLSDPTNERQPFVTIRLVGFIDLKGIKTPFSLQTSVSQRKLDI